MPNSSIIVTEEGFPKGHSFHFNQFWENDKEKVNLAIF